MFYVRLLAILLLSALLSGSATARSPVPGGAPSLAPMLDRVLPGIVSIAVHGQAADEPDPLLSDPYVRKFFGLPDDLKPGKHEVWTAGSGVIVRAQEGYVLTSQHVVENADNITVVLADGRRLPATVLGSDSSTDLAVIRIEAKGLTGATLGNSDNLKVGDYVVAVGNPFALGQSVTMGIVSALHKNGLQSQRSEDLIQTDASINPGNSGGALVNLNGEVVGINSMVFAPSGTNSGISFAIPINTARDVMHGLIKHGKGPAARPDDSKEQSPLPKLSKDGLG